MNIYKNFLNAYNILPLREQKYTKKLFIFLFFSFFIEMLSIGALIPSISFFISPEIYEEKYTFIFNVMQKMSFLDGDLKSDILLILLSIFTFKFLFMVALNYYQSDFIYKVQTSISAEILKKYFTNSYYFFIKTNSSIIIRNVIIEVEQFAIALISYNFFFNEILILFGVTVLLLIYQPTMTLILIATITLLIIFYNLLTKKIIEKFGLERQKYEGERIKNLNEIVGSIKDIKMQSLEKFFLRDFNESNRYAANSSKWIKIYQSLPKNILEIIIVIGFLGIAFFFLKESKINNEFIVLGGIYTICVIKLMPSVNRILSSFQRIRYSMPVIDNIRKELTSVNDQKKSLEIKDFNKINVKSLSFTYPKSGKKNLLDIDLEITKGKIYGIIGTSGSGKSTLVNIISGLLNPDQGKIKIDNQSFPNFECLRNLIGYMPQNIFLLDDSIAHNIALGVNKEKIDFNKIKQLLQNVKLDTFIKSLPNGLHTMVGERGAMLSGGQLQRLGLARALYKNPSILIFDEFTSSLDKLTEIEILNNIKMLKGSKTLIISSHSDEVKKICDKIYVIENGKIISNQ
jgi:ATP-binding cassette, subfamily B, bacterial PglK